MKLDQIICGDNVEVMRGFPDACIDLVVTSPPYDELRQYGGHSWNFEAVAKELTRLLKPGGVIVWVVADATVDGSETGTSFEQALYFKNQCGLNLHDTMIYKQAAVGAKGSNLSYWQEWEFMFVLSKGRPKAVNRIADRKNSTAGTARRFNQKCEKVGTRQHSNTIIADEGVRGNVWEYMTGMCDSSFRSDHPAPYPEKLARDHIYSWSNEGDIVLDPFSGSGTTADMARDLGRHYIGIEVNPEYVEISQQRLSQQLLF